MRTIPIDKFERIGCQTILNHKDYVNNYVNAKNIAKERIVSDIVRKMTDFIKVSETETPLGVKLSVDILFVNFKDLDNYENDKT